MNKYRNNATIKRDAIVKKRNDIMSKKRIATVLLVSMMSVSVGLCATSTYAAESTKKTESTKTTTKKTTTTPKSTKKNKPLSTKELKSLAEKVSKKLGIKNYICYDKDSKGHFRFIDVDTRKVYDKKGKYLYKLKKKPSTKNLGEYGAWLAIKLNIKNWQIYKPANGTITIYDVDTENIYDKNGKYLCNAAELRE